MSSKMPASTDKTFTAYFRRYVEDKPSREVIITYDEDLNRKSLTLSEAFKLSSRLAYLLRSQGIRRGDVVTSTLPTSLEAAVVNFGIVLAGAVALTVDVVSQSGEELFHVINKSQSKLVILRSDTEDKAWQVMRAGVEEKQTTANCFFVRQFSMPRVSYTSHVVLADRENKDENGDGFLDYLRKQTSSYVDDDVTQKDGAMIFLTSGTTGFPKLAKYSHNGIIENVECGKACLEIPEGSKYYIASSWSWAVAAPIDILWRLIRVSPDSWHTPKDAIKLHANIMRKENVKSGLVSPISAVKIHDEIMRDNPKPFIFEQLFVAGVPLNIALGERLLKACKLLTVRYGCSEHVVITYNHMAKVSDIVEYDCGCIYPGVQVRVVDEKFEDVPDGEPGLILIKTTATFECYLNDPEKSAKCLTKDGWYNTSDAGYFLPENKHLVVMGRYDYLITHKSTNIYPAWIERPIREHPEVQDVVVLPVPHETNNQDICACVIRNPGSKLTTSEVQDIIRNHPPQSGKQLMPPHHVIFYDAFPGNARGKIVMNELIDNAKAAVKKQSIISTHVHMG